MHPPWIRNTWISVFFLLFYIISTQTIYVNNKKLHTLSRFATLRAISNLFSFFYTPCRTKWRIFMRTFKLLYLSRKWSFFKTNFRFSTHKPCSSKPIHDFRFRYFFNFWRQVHDVIFPPKYRNSKNWDDTRIVCSMFVRNLVREGWKVKKL